MKKLKCNYCKIKFHLYAINLLCLFWIFFAIPSFSQNIPASRRVDWAIAGIQGGIPCRTTNIYNFVTSFSGDNTGATDNSTKLNNALVSTPADAVIYFPNGTYRFNSTINVPSNKVIRGESVTGTVFNFTLTNGNNCFNVQGTQTATSSTITASLLKGGNSLTLSSATGFNANDDVLMEQVNGTIDNDPASWADNLRGQLFVVSSKASNTLTLDRTFTLDYSTTNAITLYKVNLIKNVGFESFTIDRLDANFGTGNETFLLEFTANCWMSCVRSLRTGRYHVYLSDTRNAEIRGCYFYQSKDYNGGGNGYGVLCQDHVGECLIENNIFRQLRHALIVKEGASRNVYGYNYSREATWGSAGIPADISVHGHYPYHNLFESNIVQRVTITDAWGRSGPANTIFRNRIEGTTDVWVQFDSDNQNFEANELTGAGAAIDFNHDGTISGTLRSANNINGTIDFAPASTVLNSYYLSGTPSFFGALPFPAIGYGTTFNTRTIPARARYASYQSSGDVQDLMTHCTCTVLPVQLLNFNHKDFQEYIHLRWNTAIEKESDYFHIERSSDGVTFEVVGTVQAQGNSSDLVNYYYDDYFSESGIFYYRLVQYDTNGTVYYSSIHKVDRTSPLDFIISENPFNNSALIFIKGRNSEAISYFLSDLSGKVLKAETLSANAHQFMISADIHSGLYILTIDADQLRRSFKIVKY